MAQTTTPICWIHGWGASSSVWNDLAALFPEAEHFYVDYSACGSADDIRHVLSQILNKHEGPWTLIGWSMGGMIALEEVFQGIYPIASVVVISATLKFVSADRTEGWPLRVVERMRKQLSTDNRQVLEQFIQSMFINGEQWNDCDAAVETDLTPEGLDAGLAYLSETDLTESWARWRLIDTKHRSKLLWIHGDSDTICPPGCIPSLAAHEVILLKETGHAPMLTRIRQLEEAIRGFIYAD